MGPPVKKGPPSPGKAPGKAKAKERKRKSSDGGSETSSIASDPVSFEICHSEGNTFRNMGIYKKAVNSYTRALNMKPKNKAVLLARSQCYQQLGNNELALADANAIVGQDPTSVKGLLQKADVYYQMGHFEHALMLYHRGHKFRPEIQTFRLGIQKSKEAIENSIGEDSGIQLEKKGDLSFFIEEQKPPSKRKDAMQRQQQQSRRQTTQDAKMQQTKKQRKDRDKKTVKQLLGELYEDMTYLEELINESEKTSKTKTNEQVTDIANECLDYLDSRAEFWQQQQPTYSREQERINRTRGLHPETKKKTKNKKQDPTKWVRSKMADVAAALDNKEYEDCIDKAERVLKELEKYSEAEIPRKKEFTGDLHSLMGIAYIEMESYEEAVKHLRIDYRIAKELDLEPQITRAMDNLGATFAKMGRHTEAIKIFTERLPLTTSAIEDAWLYHELGRCHLELEETNTALEFGEKSRKTAEESGDEVWRLNSTILIAEAQLKLDEHEDSLMNFELALEMSRTLKDSAAENAIKKIINTLKHKEEENIEESQKIEKQKEDNKEQQKEDDNKEQQKEQSNKEQQKEQSNKEQQKEQSNKEQQKEKSNKEQQKEDSKSGTTKYKISVAMSDLQNAGTDGDLEIEIIGQKGSSGRMKLTTSETNSKKHDKGQTDRFTVTGADVGEISKIIVKQTCDLPGLGCHLDHVTVRPSDVENILTFKCNKWFDTAMDDGLIEREFTSEK